MTVSRGVRQTSTTHPGYRLSPTDRLILGWLAAEYDFTKTRLSEIFDVSRKTVNDCKQRWLDG